MLVVLANSKDPAREEELKSWYVGTHLPDVVGTGIYHSAAFYESAGTDPDQPRFAAVYVTDPRGWHRDSGRSRQGPRAHHAAARP